MKTLPAVAVLAGALIAAWPAAADDTAECVATAEKGQVQRDQGKYRDAMKQFLQCTRDICPAIVREDCARWVGELEHLTPTIVVSARDADGRDLGAVRVLVDGVVLVEHLDGTPIAVEPGEHVFRYEADDRPPIEERLIVHAAEHGRVVRVVLPPAATAAPAKPEASPAKKVPIATVVAASIGAVALGSFAYFGVTGAHDYSALKAQPCAATRSCSIAEGDAIHTKFVVADVSLAVGVVALGVAVWTFLADRTDSTVASTRRAAAWSAPRGPFLLGSAF